AAVHCVDRRRARGGQAGARSTVECVRETAIHRAPRAANRVAYRSDSRGVRGFFNVQWPQYSARPGQSLRLPDHIARHWPIWRLVFEGKATLSEIRATWTLKDVWSANAILDAIAEADYLEDLQRGASGTTR